MALDSGALTIMVTLAPPCMDKRTCIGVGLSVGAPQGAMSWDSRTTTERPPILFAAFAAPTFRSLPLAFIRVHSRFSFIPKGLHHVERRRPLHATSISS
jgi:hypothetical protein